MCHKHSIEGGALMMRITITFKENERYIYEEIQRHSAKANWVKDVLAEYIKAKNESKEKTIF